MIVYSSGSETARYYYHFDGSGSVVALSNSSGSIAEQYSYDCFGTPNAASTLGNRFMFTGREYDSETGLYFFRARFYKPSIGRFLQTDPVGYGDGMNLYGYCGNNPIIWGDPFGLCKSKSIAPYLLKLLRYLLMKSSPGVEITFDMVDSLTDYYSAFLAAGLDPAEAALEAVNMTIGKIVGYGTLAEGIEGVDVGTLSETHGLQRAGQVGLGIVQTTISVVASGQVIDSLKGATVGGENAAAARGREVHEQFAEKVKQKAGGTWKSEQRIPESNLRPDAIDPKGRPIELKPDTPSGRAAGARQIEKYKNASKTNGRVIYYKPES